MRAIDLSNQRINDWLVLKRDPTNRKQWICQCKCGTIKSLSTGNIKRSKCCIQCFARQRLIDLSGKRFGNWRVLNRDTSKRFKTPHWICRCICGNICSVNGINLKKGTSRQCKTCCGNEFKDLTGQKFGHWTVYSQSKKARRWICICDCGTRKEVLSYHLLSGASTKCSKCSGWEGYKEIPKTIYTGWKLNAERRNLDWNLSIEYIWELYEKQNKCCALTGLLLKFAPNSTTGIKLQTVSLDRIDSTKGYIEGNVQLVHKIINFMKYTNTQEDFILFCNLVSQKHPIEINKENCKYSTGYMT